MLQEHGDLSAAEIAERLSLTTSTCWRRVSRLEEQGVIRKRVALLDREKLGLAVMVFSHVKVAGHGRDALLRFEQAVRAHPEILECYTLMGETDFLLRIACRDIKAYEAFFLDHLSRFPGVQSVNSSIALAVIKETTALPLHAGLAAVQHQHAARRIQPRHLELARGSQRQGAGSVAELRFGPAALHGEHAGVTPAHSGATSCSSRGSGAKRPRHHACRRAWRAARSSLRACTAVTLSSP